MSKFLYIMNDKNMDIEGYIKHYDGVIIWKKRPKRILINERIYVYLSGKSKCVKYEFEVIDTNVDRSELEPKNFIKYRYNKDFDKSKLNDVWKDIPLIKMKLIRTIKNTDQTTNIKIKEKGKVLGSLMSNRELRPYSIEYLDSIK